MRTFVPCAAVALCFGVGSAAYVHAGQRVDAPGDPQAAVGPVELTLLNGWTGAPFGTNQPSVELAFNIVRFKGAIGTSGTSANPFVLPKAFRPKTDVYVPVDLCGSTNGRLYINTAGVVTVQAQNDFSNAQCFTSLDGVSFSKNPTGTQALTLRNGWSNAPFSTSDAAVRLIAGVVRFSGAVAGGTTAQLFRLPPEFRPKVAVYVPVDLCNANPGRLVINPSGSVSVQTATAFTDAQCFTSLEGASFALTASRKLTLRNGWTGAPFGTANPGVENKDGVVHFRGAISTSGTDSRPFKLPVEDRPSAETYIKVDLCSAANGRLRLTTDGTVYVQAEGDFSSAQCFTSLDGATFVQ